MRAAVLRRIVAAVARLDALVDGAVIGASSPAGGAGGGGSGGSGSGGSGSGGLASGGLGSGSGGSGSGGMRAGSGTRRSGGSGATATGPVTSPAGTATAVLAELSNGAVIDASDDPTNAASIEAVLAGDGSDNGELELPNSVDGMLNLLEAVVGRAASRIAEAEAANRRLLAALAHVPEGVVIADPNGSIIFRNPQAAGFVGARHGEALAERALGELLAAAVAGFTNEESLELFSPPRRTLAIRARPLLESGERFGAVAIIEDVSEKRRLEAVRRDFVANISHELKTPVGALSLVAETLEGEDDPAVVARLSRRMRTEAERLGRIIEDLLDLSRIEAEESPSRDPVPVRLILGQAIDRLRPVGEHQGISLDVEDPPDYLIILGDRRQLVSAIHNLVDNAIKYSERGSAVQIRVIHDDDWIEITVADRGIGIPSRDLERVFERFYRVDRARSRDTGGTGLGLSIVRHVAGNHGGEVSVESREGEGSTFFLRLPNGTLGIRTERRDAEKRHEEN